MEYTVDTKEIKKAMIDNDIGTITELAIRAGIARNTCSDIVNGNILPSADAMRKLARTLGFDSEKAGRVFFAIKLT